VIYFPARPGLDEKLSILDTIRIVKSADMAHDVFISYSSKDKPVADAICANLEGAGVRCWIAPRDIAPGEDWPTAISMALSQSRIMVLIFSTNANSSDQISRELSLAADYKLVIIPFKIDNVIPEPGKQYFLSRTHWLDAMNPPTQEQINSLVSRVSTILSASDDSKITREGTAPFPGSTKKILAVQEPAIRKKAAWSRILWIPVVFVLVGMAGWFGLSTIKRMSQTVNPLSTRTVSPATTSSSTPASTLTLPPTSTARPMPSQTVGPTAFSRSILAYIAEHTPTFEENFSNTKFGWGNNSEGFAIFDLVENGTLVVQDHIEPDWGENPFGPDFRIPGVSFPTNGLFDASDFALQFIIKFGDLKSVGLQFRSTYTLDTGYRVTLYPSGDWDLKKYPDETPVAEGHIWISSGYQEVILIAKGNNVSFFLNDGLIYEGDDLSSSRTSNRIVVYGNNTKSSGSFDNFKFWNLDGLDF
jgi:hypothetical protein